MNKLCGAAPFCAGYWLPHMPCAALLLPGALAAIAAGEEVLILLRCKRFDANIRGLHI